MNIRAEPQGRSRGVPIDGKVPGMMVPSARGTGMEPRAANAAQREAPAGEHHELHRFERGMTFLSSRQLPRRWPAVLELTKKICVLGDSAVGKTSLIRRYAQDCFEENYKTTVGARVLWKTQVLSYPDRSLEVRLNLNIWEISGQNRHLGLYPAYYRGAEGAMVVGDAARLDTQVNLWKWIEGFRASAGRVPVILLVNKTDILDTDDFDFGFIDDLSREFDCPYRLASARTGESVARAFRELGHRLVGKKLASPLGRVSAC